MQPGGPNSFDNYYLSIVARLKPGVSVERAQAELTWRWAGCMCDADTEVVYSLCPVMLVVHLGDDDLGRAGERGRGCGAGAAVVDDSCDPLEEGLLVFESLLDGNLVLARH